MIDASVASGIPVTPYIYALLGVFAACVTVFFLLALNDADDDTWLVVTGRAKDIIIRNGENISPKEVEDILVGHPQVAEIAIVGLPDARTGERACAVIVPRSGPGPDVASLRAFLEATRHRTSPIKLQLTGPVTLGLALVDGWQRGVEQVTGEAEASGIGGASHHGAESPQRAAVTVFRSHFLSPLACIRHEVAKAAQRLVERVIDDRRSSGAVVRDLCTAGRTGAEQQFVRNGVAGQVENRLAGQPEMPGLVNVDD